MTKSATVQASGSYSKIRILPLTISSQSRIARNPPNFTQFPRLLTSLSLSLPILLNYSPARLRFHPPYSLTPPARSSPASRGRERERKTNRDKRERREKREGSQYISRERKGGARNVGEMRGEPDRGPERSQWERLMLSYSRPYVRLSRDSHSHRSRCNPVADIGDPSWVPVLPNRI